MLRPPASQSKALRVGLAITTVGGLLFTLDLPLLRLAGADSWTLIFLRGIFQALSLTVMWLILRVATGRNESYLAGGAGVAVGVTSTVANLTYIGAVNNTTAANIVFITALIPIITAVMAWIFLRERVHLYTWLATVIAFSGVAIIVIDSISRGGWIGDLLALASMVATAGSLKIIRASGKNVATSFAVGSLASALIAWPFVPSTAVEPSVVFWVALSGLIVMPLASSLVANGTRFVPSADVSMFFLLETTLTPIWVWLIFGEKPTALAMLGGTIVILTLLLHSGWRLSRSLGSGGGVVPRLASEPN
jgi:drug/metabolite transporter (DMT)-like permease